MKKKSIIFNGLGFPIVLINGGVKSTSYGDALDIDFRKLHLEVFEALIRKPAKLSGAEVRFIRHYMELSQLAFADFLGVERSSVGKWEAKDLDATGMATAIETLLRIRMTQRQKRSIDEELKHIDPGVRKSGVGAPIQISA